MALRYGLSRGTASKEAGMGSAPFAHASRGAAISVSEEDIKNSRSLLAKQEGIFCEASSAVSYAAYKKDSESGCISKDDKTVCLITGHGLKQKTSY